MAGQGTGGTGPLRRVGVREFRGAFSDFMRQVREGSSFEVTSRDRVIAVVRPPEALQPRPRQPGALRGRIVMAADFDETPPDLIALLEGGGD